jgi:transcription elongation factor Elf1
MMDATKSARIICLHCGHAKHVYIDNDARLKCSLCGPSAQVEYARSADIIALNPPHVRTTV